MSIPICNIITPPKTEKGVRRVLMPDFYADKMKDYLETIQFNEPDRIFPFTKSYLHHEMRRGCAASGVKRIRIHGIRHSYISLLIDMGFSTVAIADRVGHDSIDMLTFNTLKRLCNVYDFLFKVKIRGRQCQHLARPQTAPIERFKSII